MISVDAVEASLAELSSEASVEAAMLAFAHEQVPYLQYLQTESFELLSQDERDYLQYLALVIYGAVKGDIEATPSLLTGEEIEKWDERCWEWMQATVGKPMSERLNVFFDNIDQEELLAFAEDSLVDPDANDADALEAADGVNLFESGASRELAFVALGALIASLDSVL